jgi:hypothetical protein
LKNLTLPVFIIINKKIEILLQIYIIFNSNLF